jgi:hypothetical protein
MAVVSGNVIGNLSGKLGNLSARTVNGQTILAARPSSFNTSQDPAVVETRQKFSVTATFSKGVLSLSALEEIWKKVKASGMSVFNTVFRGNFAFSSTETPTVNNIITPDGFALPLTTVVTEADKFSAVIPALNTHSVFTPEEVGLSVNSLIVYHDPKNADDAPFQVIAFNEEMSNYNFAQSTNLEVDFNVNQVAVAAKYNKSILYIAVASKDAAGKIIQHSSTFQKASA